ncbi:MAG: hypothetical protein H6659_14320 [Ardenticatenaceae bacterium]|nr:hypothetical protein [Anaerolineales bacterium]MCB8985003.1 hypothetical protein [Ardenticatenaceae bacterium]MCB8987931.1 hypothetical protein [Ardenticatenaceae bacterium]
MLVKRLILAVVSLVFGVVTTYIILLVIGTTYDSYGFGYFFFTSLALACFLAIWLDKFMDTKILPK